MAITVEEMERLRGFRFPGGSFTVERWENFLLHDVALDDPPRDGVGHPIYAFHAPLAAMGMTYQEFFDLCQAESPDAIRAGEYDFRFVKPLREGVTYTIRGEILDVERKQGKRAGMFDLVTFELEMIGPGGDVALVARNSWVFLRSGS